MIYVYVIFVIILKIYVFRTKEKGKRVEKKKNIYYNEDEIERGFIWIIFY